MVFEFFLMTAEDAEKNKLLRSKLPGIRVVEIAHSVVTPAFLGGVSPNISWIPLKACGNGGLRQREQIE